MQKDIIEPAEIKVGSLIPHPHCKKYWQVLIWCLVSDCHTLYACKKFWWILMFGGYEGYTVSECARYANNQVTCIL